jgi:hypothetical protein
MSGSNIPPNIFKVQDVFLQLYGVVPPHISELVVSTQAKNPYTVNSPYSQRSTTLKGSPLYGLSDTMGREVFCPLQFKAGDNTYDFPYAIIGLKSKILTKETPMIERGGVVIEEIGAGPWEISIKGFLMNPDMQFPDDQLDAINQLYQYRQPVNIISALTDLFLDINDQVVITSVDIPPKPKVIGVRDFSMTVIQDSVLDLYSVE